MEAAGPLEILDADRQSRTPVSGLQEGKTEARHVVGIRRKARSWVKLRKRVEARGPGNPQSRFQMRQKSERGIINFITVNDTPVSGRSIGPLGGKRVEPELHASFRLHPRQGSE